MGYRLLWKDTIREIYKTKLRFFSLVLLTALGVGCFLGFRTGIPSMEQWAEDFFQETQFMDLKIQSDLGFTEEMVDDIRRIEGVTRGEIAFTYEGYLEEEVVLLQSIATTPTDQTLHQLRIIQGVYPTHWTEVVVSPRFLQGTGYQLGDSLQLEYLVDNQWYPVQVTLVAVAQSPLYVSDEGGVSSLGLGRWNSLCFVTEEFVQEMEQVLGTQTPTVCYITVEQGQEEQVAERVQTLGQSHYESQQTQAHLVGEAQAQRALEQWQAQEQQLSLQEDENLAQAQWYETEIATAWANYQQAQDQWSEEEKEGARYEITLLEESYQLSLLFGEQQIAQGQQQVEQGKKLWEQAQRHLLLLEQGGWVITNRSDNPWVASFQEEVLRWSGVALVFPLIFYGVSVVLSITTLWSMVQRQRNNNAILGAMGYYPWEIALKYVCYGGLSGCLGGLLGLVLGLYLLPTLLYQLWSQSYALGDISYGWYPEHSVPVVLATVLLLTLTAFFVCICQPTKEPATLLRPQAPKAGGRIFLERWDILWVNLTFRDQVTLRNVCRNPLRFWVSVGSIGAITGVVVSSYGLGEAVSLANQRQYEEIYRHTTEIHLVPQVTEGERLEVEGVLSAYGFSGNYTAFATQTVTSSGRSEEQYDVELATVEDGDALDLSVNLRLNRYKPYNMPQTGAIIPFKLGEELGLALGDTLVLTGDFTAVDNGKEGEQQNPPTIEVMVTAIAEQYDNATIYMTHSYYNRFVATPVAVNLFCLDTQSLQAEHPTQWEEMIKRLLALDGVAEVKQLTQAQDSENQTIAIMKYSFYAVGGSAFLLAFVVLSHLNVSNITARRGELATLKVLGFTDYELSAYIYRENMILTFYGVLLGMVIGQNFHYYLVRSLELPLLMYFRGLDVYRFLWGAITIVLFAVVVNIMDYKRMQKLPLTQEIHGLE